MTRGLLVRWFIFCFVVLWSIKEVRSGIHSYREGDLENKELDEDQESYSQNDRNFIEKRKFEDEEDFQDDENFEDGESFEDEEDFQDEDSFESSEEAEDEDRSHINTNKKYSYEAFPASDNNLSEKVDKKKIKKNSLSEETESIEYDDLISKLIIYMKNLKEDIKKHSKNEEKEYRKRENGYYEIKKRKHHLSETCEDEAPASKHFRGDEVEFSNSDSVNTDHEQGRKLDIEPRSSNKENDNDDDYKQDYEYYEGEEDTYEDDDDEDHYEEDYDEDYDEDDDGDYEDEFEDDDEDDYDEDEDYYDEDKDYYDEDEEVFQDDNKDYSEDYYEETYDKDTESSENANSVKNGHNDLTGYDKDIQSHDSDSDTGIDDPNSSHHEIHSKSDGRKDEQNLNETGEKVEKQESNDKEPNNNQEAFIYANENNPELKSTHISIKESHNEESVIEPDGTRVTKTSQKKVYDEEPVTELHRTCKITRTSTQNNQESNPKETETAAKPQEAATSAKEIQNSYSVIEPASQRQQTKHRIRPSKHNIERSNTKESEPAQPHKAANSAEEIQNSDYVTEPASQRQQTKHRIHTHKHNIERSNTKKSETAEPQKVATSDEIQNLTDSEEIRDTTEVSDQNIQQGTPSESRNRRISQSHERGVDSSYPQDTNLKKRKCQFLSNSGKQKWDKIKNDEVQEFKESNGTFDTMLQLIYNCPKPNKFFATLKENHNNPKKDCTHSDT